MDYIARLIDRKLRFLRQTRDTPEQASFLRVKIEYGLLFIVGYLWNKNLSDLEPDARQAIYDRLLQPTLGALLEISRTLDINKEVFSSKGLRKSLNKYPQLRNERIGHGYVFADGVAALANALEDMATAVFGAPNTPLSRGHDLVLVQKQINGVYSGINFKSNGQEYVPWRCPPECETFEVGSTYSFCDGVYSKLSPFIEVAADEQFYVFRDVRDRLTGKVCYNRLFQTGSMSREWLTLMQPIEEDETRCRTANGTVMNTFRPNYRKYIDIGVRSAITDYLLNNRSSVCATVWGHGGVGKTATVQSICADLGSRDHRAFDYIIFASAKDRYYDYYTGSIKSISERTIESYESLIRCVNGAIGSEEPESVSSIVSFEGRILIVVDDYETFPEEARTKIEDFIRKLDIDKHKILITTRANIVIGVEFQTSELDPGQTVDFLLQVLSNEFPDDDISHARRELEDASLADLVYSVTSGRPLFILQLALVWAQHGTLRDALRSDVKAGPAAIDFLYGRIFDYLSQDARRLFVAISQLVTKDDPSNLIEKLQYITSMENDDEAFNRSFAELVKLRLLQNIEGKFFRVYSTEILQIMSAYFSQSSDAIRGAIVSRIQQVTRDKKLDNEHALLENANRSRYVKAEEETVSLYRQILNRPASPLEVKLTATLNLADYLFNHRGKKSEAVQVLSDHRHLFPADPTVTKAYGNYCWALGRKEAAIQAFADLFARKPDFGTNHDARLELTGLHITYACILATERKEEIKTMKRFGEISAGEFSRRNRDIKNEMNRIFGIGWKLFGFVRGSDVTALSPACRQSVLGGLLQLVEVAIRLGKHKEAHAICSFGVDRSSGTYPNAFRRKRSYVEAIGARNPTAAARTARHG